MKKFTCLLLALLFVLTSVMFVSCDDVNTDDPADTTESNIPTESDTPSESQGLSEEVPADKNRFDLSEFTIVAPSRDTAIQDLAASIQKKLSSEFGVELPVIKSTKKAAKEIILGNCGRAVANDFFNMSQSFNKYGVVVDDSKIFIAGTTKENMSKALDYFIETYLANGTTFDIEKELFVVFEGDLMDIPARKNEGEIRFVSHNIMFMSMKNDPARKDMLLTAMSALDADIVAMQEADNPWRQTMGLHTLMGSLGYAKVNIDAFTPLYFKKDKFTLIDQGSTPYTAVKEWGSNNSYIWAVLKDNQTGKKFIVANTHFIWQDNGKMAPESVRAACAEQLVADLKARSQKHGNIPVMTAGDFNSNLNSDAYAILSADLYSARDNAAETKNMDYKTSLSGYGQKPSAGGNGAIDHVFYSKTGVEGLYFETSLSPLVYCYSDHTAVCFDFKLS